MMPNIPVIQDLRLVFLLISNLTNGLHLHHFLVTKSTDANGAH